MDLKLIMFVGFLVAFECMASDKNIRPENDLDREFYQAGLDFGKGQSTKLNERQKQLFISGFTTGLFGLDKKEKLFESCGEVRDKKMKCVDRTLKQSNIGTWFEALKNKRNDLMIIDSMCWNVAYTQIEKKTSIKDNEYLALVKSEYEKMNKKPRWGEKKYKFDCAGTHKNFDPCIKAMVTFENNDFVACTEIMKKRGSLFPNE